jgi:murein DD-endopeptidase MepM/ murein hydrolase activator NlpD
MATHRKGKHRQVRQRHLPLPAVAGTATIAIALVGSLTVGTAGATVSPGDATRALDAPTRPAATEQLVSADPFADILTATDALTSATEQAATSSHETIRAAEIKAKKAALKREREQERRLAAQRAARQAEERARLASMYTKPLEGYRVSTQYGVAGYVWSRGYHTGLDLTASYGTPVKAIHSGQVTFAGWDGAYGYKVEITHPDGTQTWYAHMSSLAVSGGTVTTGQVIGSVGSTGNSYGNHLHLEVHGPDGSELNPYSWLQGKGISL